MVKIFVKEGQSIESVLKKFKAKLKKAGVIEDHKRSLRFEKRSDRLRRERMARKIRARKAQDFIDRI
ncbi:MAG: 30S ribosomal protein S21 [Candidatus Omnitrophica bacterium]|nr:30S ribosomal protein S21 [Candidatus Omnitrophota bacterium]